MPPVRVVSWAEEEEHRKAEAQLTAERAGAALVAELIEKGLELFAENNSFF